MLFMVCMMMWAAPVSRQQAQQKAAAFLVSKGAVLANDVKMSVRKARKAASDEQAYYYVFNAGEKRGFVVVSGDDRTESILGYADKGEITEENMPANMRAWLQGYADQIEWLDQHAYVAPIVKAPRAVRKPVAPLLTSKWDQEAPYNLYCPVMSGERTVTGCMATAMAQVMYYHRANSVSQTLAVIPGYTTSTNKIRISAIGITNIDWGNMQDEYDSSATSLSDPSNAAVAKLMQLVGASLKMDYDLSENGGSGAFSEDVHNALVTYFGYDHDLLEADRNLYSYSEWIQHIYEELQRGPVLYCGQSMGGGHAFVCDGYETDDFFHINWGWGGMSDGYFKLSVLSPSEQGIGGSSTSDGFSFAQTAFLNVRPQDNGIADELTQPTAGETKVEAEISLIGNAYSDKDVGVKVTLTNKAATAYSGDLYLFEYRNSDYTHLSALQIEDLPTGETQDVTFTFTPSHSGSTRLVVADKNYEVAGYTSITVGGTAPAASLSVVSSSITGRTSSGAIYGNRVRGIVNVKNTGIVANTDGVFVALADYDAGYFTQTMVIPATIPAGETVALNFEFENLTYSHRHAISFLEFNENFSSLFTTYRAVVTYKADGTTVFSAPTNSFTVGSDVLAADFSQVTSVNDITPNSNPNTLYILRGTKTTPASLNGKNVVKNQEAATLTITDGYGFYSPVDFVAGTATYVRQFSAGINGTDGWSTLVLPFKVETVKQGTATLDWFRSSTDEEKDFWLMEFADDNATGIAFDYAAELEANIPYLIGVPGSEWGSEKNLTGKDITFTATDALIQGGTKAIVTGDHFKFVGNMSQTTMADSYVLNAAGNAFVQQTEAETVPFRACFAARRATTVATLPIGITLTPKGDGLTAISAVRQSAQSKVYYDLQGRRVAHPVKGSIYIVRPADEQGRSGKVVVF